MKKILIKTYWLVFITMIHPALAQEGLYDYLELAAENNPGLRASFKDYLAALEEVPQVNALPDPQLMFGYFIAPVETRVGAQQFTLSASQAFPWFGTLQTREDAAVQQAKVAFQEFQSQKLTLFEQVKTTYNNMYFLQKSIDISRENLVLLESLKELARINFEANRASFSDILQVEMQQENLQTRLENLESQIVPVLTRFNQLLNRDKGASVSLPETIDSLYLPESPEIIYQQILSRNPNLEKLDQQVKAMEYQQKVAKKLGMPSFTVGVNYINVAPRTDMEMPDNGQDAIMAPQVGVKIPIFQKKYKSMIREAQIKQEAVALRQENFRKELETRLAQLYNDYLQAQREIGLNQKLADLAQRSLDLLQSEFSTGDADFEQLLNMEAKLLNYSLALEKARVQRNDLVYQLQTLTGQDLDISGNYLDQ
ncbi:MAG: TolC family protein [Candidatus Cyclobacteriaceae bacterium M3_2C_046]